MIIGNNNFQENLFQEAIKKHQDGNYNSALKLYKRILTINPNLAAIHNNIGLIYYELNKNKLSLKSYLQAININNNFIEAHNNLGILYEKLGEYKKAILHCQKVIEIDPNFSKVYNNLGSVFEEIGEKNKAIKSYLKSIELDPYSVESYNNLGSIYRYLGNYHKAIEYYKKGIQINNNYPKIRKNLSLVYLILSKFKKGFEEFEWRILEKNKKEYQDLNLKSLLWNGENLDGKIILILSEQGIGDIVQFFRYVYELQNKFNVKIIFKTNKKLIHFLKNPIFTVISEETKIPKHDYHIYLLSLPKFYYLRDKKLLKAYNYIKKNNNIYSKWKQKLSKIKSKKIGINWQGNKRLKIDKYRSIPLEFFNPLFQIKNISYISLQKGEGEEQIEKIKFKKDFYNFASIVDLTENAFEDTIEIIRNLDYVITSDSAIAHISSTMGIKTWLLLPYSADWRWFIDRSSSPWYNSMKLFRQKKEGDWSQVIKEVKKELLKKFS